jgi:hypothetical protein
MGTPLALPIGCSLIDSRRGDFGAVLVEGWGGGLRASAQYDEQAQGTTDDGVGWLRRVMHAAVVALRWHRPQRQVASGKKTVAGA